jgi:hypothetical protein
MNRCNVLQEVAFREFIQKLYGSAYDLLIMQALITLAASYQGYRMIRRRRENEKIFQKWAFCNADIRMYGWLTIGAGILVFVPIVSFWAELITACSMFLTLAVQLSIGNKKGLWLQLPFFMLNLFLMYVQLKGGILD